MLLKMVILVKRENLIKGTQSYEYNVSIILKDKMNIPSALLLLLFFCFFIMRVHFFDPKYISLLVPLETVCTKGICNLDLSIKL